jgi:hypothetical protein
MFARCARVLLDRRAMSIARNVAPERELALPPARAGARD